MKLKDYLKNKDITYEKFSEFSGIPYNTILKHILLELLQPENALKIK